MITIATFVMLLGAARASGSPALPPAAPEAHAARETESIQLADGSYVTSGEAAEIVVARIGADGKPVMACVDNPKAAARFFAGKQDQAKHK